jgi:hypothetical protein
MHGFSEVKWARSITNTEAYSFDSETSLGGGALARHRCFQRAVEGHHVADASPMSGVPVGLLEHHGEPVHRFAVVQVIFVVIDIPVVIVDGLKNVLEGFVPDQRPDLVREEHSVDRFVNDLSVVH